jgi:hypothetical protein
MSPPGLVSAVSVTKIALWEEFEPVHVWHDVATVVRLGQRVCDFLICRHRYDERMV